MVDRSVEGASVLSLFQFERVGFFAVDTDSKNEKVGVFCFVCFPLTLYTLIHFSV